MSKIVILGAGPAGLTLARLLQQNNFPFTIYEADENRHVRNQGGTLDLHPKTGQVAMQEAGLMEEFRKHSRPEGDADKIVKFDGHIYWDDNQITDFKDDGPGKPEIDRTKLRDILLDSIEPGRIQWNRKIARTETNAEDGKSTLHFADGSLEAGIDLLVGADGAWSKVRPTLTDEKPFYSGVTMVELWSEKVSEKNPKLNSFVGNGSMFAMAEGRSIISQRIGDDSIRTYACVRKPEDWKDTCGIDWSNHDAARKAVAEQYFDDCSPELKHCILESKDELVVRALYMLPVGIKWKHRKGVTLVGDSGHLMTPFAGVGVNLAMTDSLMLARAVVEKKDDLDAAVESYEELMFENAKKMAERTAHGLKMHFSSEGANERSEMMRGFYEEATGKKLSEDHFNGLADRKWE